MTSFKHMLLIKVIEEIKDGENFYRLLQPAALEACVQCQVLLKAHWLFSNYKLSKTCHFASH